MSTAILLSGQLRTFARCYPTQRWHVLRHFADPHFFFFVQSQPDALALLAPVIADYGADHVHIEQFIPPDLKDDLTPTLTAAYHHAPYSNSVPAHALLIQHWAQSKVWEHFKAVGAKPPLDKFTTLIRLRPDLFFHSFECFGADDLHPEEVLTPWWGRFGGLNDRFAIMGPEAARAYFDVHPKIPELLALGCPFHPETLLAARLEMSSISVSQTLRAEFSTLRTDGTSRPPEISPIDLAHAALR